MAAGSRHRFPGNGRIAPVDGIRLCARCLKFPTLPHALAAAAGARLVHVSSDAVFSGTAPSYDETYPPDPVTPYGAAKAAAETAVKGITLGAVTACWIWLRLRLALAENLGETRRLSARLCTSMSDDERLAGAL